MGHVHYAQPPAFANLESGSLFYLLSKPEGGKFLKVGTMFSLHRALQLSFGPR